MLRFDCRVTKRRVVRLEVLGISVRLYVHTNEVWSNVVDVVTRRCVRLVLVVRCGRRLGLVLDIGECLNRIYPLEASPRTT